MAWYHEMGFDANPLDVRPNPKLVGLELEEKRLRNHIEKGEICFLNGLTGSGKSSLLKKLQEEMKGHKFIYLDAQDLPRSFNIEEELGKKRSFFDRITLKKFPAQSPVLIIDEFQDTHPDIVLQARSKWENPNERRIKSIVIAQIDKRLKNVTPSFKERIGNRMVTLPTLTDNEMSEILKKRLKSGRKNYYNKLHSEAVNLLVAVADGNPRRLLEYTDSIFDFHHRKFTRSNPLTESQSYLVTYYGAKEILEAHKVNVKAYKYLEPKMKKRRAEAFEKKFGSQERKTLMYAMTSPKTIEQVAKRLKVSNSKASKILNELKAQNAVEPAGKKDRKKLWKTTEHVKRLTVRV
ncbi:AAA family ATPase [Nanoarchaeota archaeon]